MRKRSEGTRLVILDSARELFIAKGYTAATVSDIADQAGISKMTLYGYFSDKLVLFLSVIQQAVGTVEDVNEIAATISSVEELYATLLSVAKNLNEIFSNPDYIELLKVLISEINVQPELKDALSNGVTRRTLKNLTVIFENTQNNEVSILKDPKSTARMFVGGFVVGAYLNGLLEPGPGKLQKLTDSELHQYVNDFIPMAVVSSARPGAPNNKKMSGQEPT